MDDVDDDEILEAIKNILLLCDEWKESDQGIEASTAFLYSVEDIIINDLGVDEL